MRTFFILLSLCALLGCENQTKTDPAPTTGGVSSTGVLFTDPVSPAVFELPSFALPEWRKVKDQKPTLVILSKHPFLEQIESGMKADVKALLNQGSATDFIERGSFYRVNPAILPRQAVSAALEDDYFSKLIWIYSTSGPVDETADARIKERLVKEGFTSQNEADTLVYDQGTASGSLRGVPFQAAPSTQLPRIQGPFVLHIDLSYLLNFQANEPGSEFQHLRETATAIQSQGWVPLVTTLSRSTLEGEIAIEWSYVLSAFRQMMQNPQLLDEMPPPWQKRVEIAQSQKVDLNDKVDSLIRETAAQYPQDADAQYQLFLYLFHKKQADEAIVQLDRAVQLDQGYGATYLRLAEMAMKDDAFEATEMLLERGKALFPQNPFIDFYLAQVLASSGNKDKALKMIDQLEQQAWSSHYHSTISQSLQQARESISAQ